MTLEAVFGHIVKLNYTLSFSNCCVILSLHAVARLSCIAIIGLFTCRVTVCFTGPEGMQCSPGVFLSVKYHPGFNFDSVF